MRPPSSAAFPGDEFTATPGAVTGIVSPPNAIGDGSIMADGEWLAVPPTTITVGVWDATDCPSIVPMIVLLPATLAVNVAV